ncbi:hypothetical protein AB0I84_33825 [Streptomyces spectabilis]|uniref:hypothetical protein n=1 Tax=Streptomyces spectabilis TaxID=68270 RepID=UPI0033CB7EBB
MPGHSRQALELTRTRQLRGLVLRPRDSVYEPGVRCRAWIRIRDVRTVDAAIGGRLPGQGRLSGAPGPVSLGEPRAAPDG